MQENPNERRGMDAVANYDTSDAFYRAKEGGETVPWRRND
jgi:hypothetical protein